MFSTAISLNDNQVRDKDSTDVIVVFAFWRGMHSYFQKDAAEISSLFFFLLLFQ